MAYKKPTKTPEQSVSVESSSNQNSQVTQSPSSFALSLSKQRDGWVVSFMEIKDGQVVRQKLTNPDLKMIAEERYKIFSQNHLFDGLPFKWE